MDTSRHTLQTLFSQLGLPNSDRSMDAFFRNHYLPRDIPLDRAAFWSVGQAQFLREAVEQDADWAETVDQLDALLRH